MEERLPAPRRRQSRVLLQTHTSETMERRQKRRSVKKEKETPDSVDLSSLKKSPIIGGQQQRYSSSFCKDIGNSRAMSFVSLHRHLNPRTRSVFLLMAGSLFLVFVVFSFVGLNPVLPVSSTTNLTTSSHLLPTEEYPPDNTRVTHLTGDNGRKKTLHNNRHGGSSSSARHFFKGRDSAVTTFPLPVDAEDVSGESKNALLGRKNLNHALMDTRRVSGPGKDSTGAKYNHTVGQHSYPSNVHSADERRDKSHRVIHDGSDNATISYLSTTSENMSTEKVSFPHLKRTHDEAANQQLREPPGTTRGVGSKKMHPASTKEVSSASLAEVPESLEDVELKNEDAELKKSDSASLLPLGHIPHIDTLHATEVPLQSHKQQEKRLNISSHPDASFHHIPPPSGTASMPTTATVRTQPTSLQMEHPLPLGEAAKGDGTAADLSATARTTEDTISAVLPPLATNLPTALLQAEAQQPQAADAPAAVVAPLSPIGGHQQVLLSTQQQADQPANEDAITTSAPILSNTPPSASSAYPAFQEQIPTSTSPALDMSQGTGAAQSPLQGPIVEAPFSSVVPSAAGGLTGSPPFVPANGISPSNIQPASTVQPATVVVAPGRPLFPPPPPPAQPVAAPLPPAVAPPTSTTAATGTFSPGNPVVTVFSTSPSTPEVSTGGASVTLQPSVPVAMPPSPVPPVATPALAPPTFTGGNLIQPADVRTPLSAPTVAPAPLAEAPAPPKPVPILTVPVKTAATGRAATEVPAAPPQTGTTTSTRDVTSEGKARTRPSNGTWGALLPPAGMGTGEQPLPTSNGGVGVNQGVTPTSENLVTTQGALKPPTCLETCDCLSLIIGGVTSLLVCFASVIVASLLMSRLFSKGFFSMAFFKGGANVIIVVAVLGMAIGGLTGGLVRRCWPGSLYFGGGLMSFFVSLVLLGKRGAAVGALGGAITGGSIGGLASIDTLPIALGCVVGLLLGIVLGFAPILRDLKMNTRYIRYGFESRQSSLHRAETTARARRADTSPGKRLSQRLFSSPSKPSSLRTTGSLPLADSVGRRAESFPSSS